MKRFGRITTLIRKMLRQGMRPEKIAMSVALGGTLGVIPVPGLSTILCIILAVVLRLNHAVVQMFNYAVYPLQLILLGGYVALGNLWFGSNIAADSFESLTALLQDGLWASVLAIMDVVFYAAVAWLVTSPVLAVIFYLISRIAAIRIQGAIARTRSATGNLSAAVQMDSGPLIGNESIKNSSASDLWQPSKIMDCKNCLA